MWDNYFLPFPLARLGWLLPAWSSPGVLFVRIDSCMVLEWILATFWFCLGDHFWWFSVLEHHFFEHEFRIDLQILKSMLDVFLIPFPFAHATCNTFKHHCFYNEFTWFYTAETQDFFLIPMIFFTCVLALIFDESWLHFGRPLASNPIFVFDCFLDAFKNRIFMDLEQKGTPI